MNTSYSLNAAKRGLAIGITVNTSVLSAVFFLIVLVGIGSAQTCIPKAGTSQQGVLTGGPNWWNTSGPNYSTDLDDPHWLGCCSFTYGSGSTEQADFRAIYTDTDLLLSWRMMILPNSTAANNVLYVGFKQAGMGDAIIRINLNATTAVQDGINGIPTGKLYYTLQYTDAQKNPLTVPSWLGDTAVWIDLNSWAVQMHVSLSGSGVNLGPSPSAFPMWFEILDGTPAVPVFPPSAWPRSGVLVITPPPTHAEQFPADSAWLTFTMDPNCSGGAVSLAVEDVGTQWSPASVISTTKNNTFHAYPLNQQINPNTTPPNTIPSGTITATFKIGEWGSTFTWTPIRGGVVIQPNDILYNQKGNFTFDWLLNTTEQGLYPDGSHHCMLVELTGPGLNFANSSVSRNMDFVKTSVFSREAEINIAGTGPLPSGAANRDVYLYVQKLNMPATISGGTTNAGYAGLTDLPIERQSILLKELASRKGGLASYFPTYRIHVYRDSGTTFRLNGVDRPVLEPQSSFGYYLSHSGKLYGWNSLLVGAKEIAPNFYKISIPIDGKAKVTTTITACETPPHHCPFCATTSCAAIIAVVTGMGLLGFVANKSRRKNEPHNENSPL